MARPAEEDPTGYRLSIIGKHFQITDGITHYVQEKFGRIEHVADQIIDVTVTLDTQKLEHSCSILMNFVHFHIKAEAHTDNLYAAIDKAVDRVIALIRKYKSKMQSHRFKDRTSVDIHVNVIEPLHDDLKIVNDEIIAESALQEEMRYQMHKVVAREILHLKTLTFDEALMKIEFNGEPFLIFREEADQKLKVLYRRPDSNYGLVQLH
jgi:putative sigma-54 modulation protein